MVSGGTPVKLDILRTKLAGSAIEYNEEHPSKALLPRILRPAGSVIHVNEEHPSKA